MTVVVALCAKSHHKATAIADTFVVPPFVGYLMIACGLLFCAIPFLPRAHGGDLPVGQFLLFGTPMWGGAFLAAVYFFRYRVVITDKAITVGAFWRRTIPFNDVIDYDVISGRYGPEAIVYVRDRTKFSLSGILPDFDELIGLIDSNMAVPPPGSSPDCPAKIEDQARRERGKRDAAWIASAGIVLIIVVACVVHRISS